MTQTHQQPRIVAVFVGNEVPEDVIELVHWVGAKMAGRGFIVLAGGMMRCDDKAQKKVKYAAICSTAPNGRWIGVLNQRTNGLCEAKPDRYGIVVSPRMADQRNFLEASLCDAAVVLKGGDGTVSEAVSALCLGKPVLLVGDTWKKDRPELYQLFSKRNLAWNQKEILVESARKRMNRNGGPISDQIKQHVVPAELRVSEYCRFQSTIDLVGRQAIDSWLADLEAVPQTGEFPVMAVCGQAKQDYDGWLNEQGIRRPSNPG